MEVEDCTIVYIGDIEFIEVLIECVLKVDLFVVEVYFFEKKVKLYLDLVMFVENLLCM